MLMLLAADQGLHVSKNTLEVILLVIAIVIGLLILFGRRWKA